MTKMKVYLERQGATWYLRFDPPFTGGGAVDEEILKRIIEEYMAEHPCESIIDSDLLQKLIEDYLKANPHDCPFDEDKIEEVVNRILHQWLIDNNMQSNTGAADDTLTFRFQGVDSTIYRIGNIVNWSANGNAVTGTMESIPAGFRPAIDVSFYTGQNHGSSPKNVTVKPTGATSCPYALEGTLSFSVTWVTNEPFRA